MSSHDQLEKTAVRKSMLARRSELAPDHVDAMSATITELVVAMPQYRNAGTICSYMAFGQEVRTIPLIERALADGKRVALPRTLFAERKLDLHEVNDLRNLIPGRYGILEPAHTAPRIAPADVDLFLIPGSVFDTQGNRLGYGAGFYDHLLVASRGARVALAYSFQLIPHVLTDEHDIPMQFIVTEQGVIDCARGRRATDHLRLRNIQCYGHHGAFAEERAQGIRLAFDIDLRLDLQLPGITDELTTTVNYPAIYQLLMEIQSAQPFNLLEALADRTAAAILATFPQVVEVTVCARKFNPPVGGILDAFEAEVTRSRPGITAS